MERSGSIRKSMDAAERVLRRGRSMVVFPEGTRSVTGEMADFLPSLGYLAMRAEIGMLPAHVAGSFESLPKGAAVPRARELTVSFGPFLASEWLATLTAGSAAAGGVAAGRGVHPAGGREPAGRRRDGAGRGRGARRVGRQGAGAGHGARADAAADPEVGAMSPAKRERSGTTLVTGGTGFLGTHLVRALARPGGARRRALARARAVARRRLGCASWGPRSCQGSVTSAEDVGARAGRRRRRLPPGRDGLAPPEDAHRMYAVHVDGTRLLCEAAARAGVQADRDGVDQRHGRRVAARRRHRRRGHAHAGRPHRRAGPTTPASSIRKRRRAARAATRWSW